MKEYIRKCILAFVSFAMLISLVQFRAVHVHAQTSDSKTDAEIIVENYGLTPKEEAILSHDSIKTTTYHYVAPGEADIESLIEVDLDANTIHAIEYKDEEGNTWVPEKAYVTENEKTTEYPLVNGDCSFISESDSYIVQVEYKTYIDIEKSTQYNLLNTPYWLVKGTEAVEEIYKAANNLELVATRYMPHLIEMRDGIETGTTLGKLKVGGDYAKAVTNLENQIKGNKSGLFDLNDMAKVYYDDYSLFLRHEYYYSELATEFKQEAINMKKNIEDIHNSQGLKTIMEIAGSMDGFKDKVNSLKSVLRYLNNIIKTLDGALVEENWVGKDKELLSVVVGDTGLTDELVYSGIVNAHAEDSIKDKVVLASKLLEYSINRNNVTVIIEANVITGTDSEELTLLKSEPFEIALKHEMSASDVEKAIQKKGFESTVLAGWFEDYQVGSDYYVRTTTNFGDKLMEDITYTITYTPKKYNVTYSDGKDTNLNVYYGYNLTLPKAGNKQSYEYLIDGETLRENTVYRVEKDTVIDRVIGKEKVMDRLLSVLADDSTYAFSELAKSILKNEAVISDTVEYRIVESGDIENTITFDDATRKYTLVAKSYPSGIDGMMWNPVKYSIILNNVESEETYDLKDGQAVFGADDYIDGVNIYYELVVTKTEKIHPITITNNYLLEKINIPSILLEESKAQVEALDYLASLAKPGGYLTMGNTISNALGMLKINYEDKYGEDKSQYPAHILKEYEALMELRANCFNKEKGNTLYVYEYILKYMSKKDHQDALGLGLIAYYSNEYGYEQYKKQLDLLVKNLSIVKDGDEFQNLLTGELAAYKDKVEQLIVVLDSLTLVAPSKYIDITNPAATKLFDILDDKKTCESFTSAKGLKDYAKVNQVAEGKVNINITVKVDETTYNSTTITLDENTVLTTNHLNDIKGALNGLYKDFKSEYYTKITSANLPKVGLTLTEDIQISESWKANVYEIYMIDTHTNEKQLFAKVTYKDTALTLLKPEIGYRYDYEINNDIVSAETNDELFMITTDNFAQLFKDGELVIERTKVDVKTEKVTGMFNALNETLSSLNSEFILIEDDKQFNVVLRVDPSESTIIQNHLMNFVMAFMESDYGYVALGNRDQALWNSERAKLSLQAFIDSLLQSDFCLDTLINVIEDTGNIKENVIDYIGENPKVIIGSEKDLTCLGGRIYNTTMYLGTTDTDEAYVEVNYIVSIEDFDTQKSTLKATKSNLLNVKNYFDFDTDGDKLNLNSTMPDDSYFRILSGMLQTGIIEFKDINSLEFSKMFDYLDLFEVMKDKNVSSTTIQNTYESLNMNANILDRGTLIDSLLNLYRNFEFKEDETVIENGMSGNMVFDLKPTLTDFEIPEEFQVLLQETELTIPSTMVCSNLSEEYEAVVKGNNDIQFVKELEDVKDNKVIILLKDINRDLSFTNHVHLDLNGFTVNGNITSKQPMVIVDKTFTTGKVTGTVTDTVRLVKPEYFTIDKVDGNINITIDPVIFYDNGKYMDVVFDLVALLTDYNSAANAIKDINFFAIKETELKEFLEYTSSLDVINESLNTMNLDELSKLVSSLVNDLLNVKDKENVGSYELITYPYFYELTHDVEKDILHGTVKPSENGKVVTVNVKLKENVNYSNVLNILKDTCTIKLNSIEISDVNYDKTLTYKTNDVKVSVEINNDAKKTVLLSTVIAYNTRNINLVKALNDYITFGTRKQIYKDALIQAFEQFTTEEIVQAIVAVSEENVTFTQMSEALKLATCSKANELDAVVQDYLDYVVSVLNAYELTGDSNKLKFENGVSIITKSFVKEIDSLSISLSIVGENIYDCKHPSSKKVITKEATCTSAGSYNMVCSECNEVLSTHSIKMIDHKYEDGKCTSCGQKEPYPLGDVNGDGKVTSLDYIKVKNHIMGTKYMTSAELKRADVSKDGKVTSLDYIKIKNHIMGTSKLF